jgi:hypothetical protein
LEYANLQLRVNCFGLTTFSQWWIRVAHSSADLFNGYIQDFFIGDGAMLTLEAEPSTGDICFIYLNKGEIHCFRYNRMNVAPTPTIAAAPLTGAVPLTVQFSSDGTYDRENDPMIFLWVFGDGTTSSGIVHVC